MSGIWSREQACDWYNNRPWLRGCNFMSSIDANRVEQWQELDFEEHMKVADAELKLAADTGFNTIRLVMEIAVWDAEHDSYMKHLEHYLETAWKYGISSMIVFGNDCMPPKDENWKPVKTGVQTCDWGYHGGRKYSQHGRFAQMGYHLLDEPEYEHKFYDMEAEIIDKYKDDPRVCIWDLYNEPGNSHRDSVTMPHLKKYYETAWEIRPSQPLTSGAWRDLTKGYGGLSEVEKYVLDNSDIISFHNYGDYLTNIKILRFLKTLGRPIICTEWLCRGLHNTVQEIYPLFYLEKVGCYNWGFVAGKYQTYEPWESIWADYAAGGARDFDFTKWFHDLYRPSYRPYDPHEIDLIKEVNRLADEDWAEHSQKK